MEEALSCIGKMPIFSGIREEELYTLIKCCDGQMAVFEKESKVKSKVISFACIMAAVSYLVSGWVSFTIL